MAVTAIAGWQLTGYVRPEDFATAVAVALIGLLWIRARIGLDIGRDTIARGVWIGVGILAITMIWAADHAGAWHDHAVQGSRRASSASRRHGLAAVIDTALAYLVGLGPRRYPRSVAATRWRVPRMNFHRLASRRCDGRVCSSCCSGSS